MNKVILRGYLVKDIEVKENNKIKLGKFTLAVSRPYKNQNGEYESDFLNCVVFNASDYIKNNLNKGTGVLLEGSIQTRTYEIEGTKRYSTDIIVNKIEILTKKEKEDIKKEQLETLHFETAFDKNNQINIEDTDLPF